MHFYLKIKRNIKDIENCVDMFIYVGLMKCLCLYPDLEFELLIFLGTIYALMFTLCVPYFFGHYMKIYTYKNISKIGRDKIKVRTLIFYYDMNLVSVLNSVNFSCMFYLGYQGLFSYPRLIRLCIIIN